MILVTGGAGFIGANFIHHWLEHHHEPVVNLDALTYAGTPRNLQGLPNPGRHHFVQGNIADTPLLQHLLHQHQPRAILHLAAQTHVDRSITGPGIFFETNVLGTQKLLDAALAYWQALPAAEAQRFRFIQMSTDEVYGSLSAEARPSLPTDSLNPSSPYAASKAAADHCVQAYRRTWGLPSLIVRCGNNYGPRQFPEKLVPLVILRHLHRQPIPIYGNGLQRREWIYVADTCRALSRIVNYGEPGQIHHVGSGESPDNLSLVHSLCHQVNQLAPRLPSTRAMPAPGTPRIQHVTDRPGHDQRYALNTADTRAALGWQPRHGLRDGLERTVSWYLTQHITRPTAQATPCR